MIHLNKHTYVNTIIGLALMVSFFGCAATKIDEKDVAFPKQAPSTKMTSYTKALRDLGLMTEVYDSAELRIQSNPIGDQTGSSGSTGGEIPRDITEMIKSALNSIGGQVVYIPYDPAFIQNQMTTGYSDFQNKIIPEVVITGGITEFDRGLRTEGDGTSAGASIDIVSAPKIASAGFGSSVGGNYDNIEKSGLSRITLDFNLINFATMSGVSRMNTVNTIEVHKRMKDKSLGINILGISFGSKGTLKRVQGRHHAVRTLVEISMIQMIGRYLTLPYWRLLDKNALIDDVVKKSFLKSYYTWPTQTRNYAAQQWLYIHGYDVYESGNMDSKTKIALRKFDPNFNGMVTANIAWKLYSSLPLSEKAYSRRIKLKNGAAIPPNQYVKPKKAVTKKYVEKKVVKKKSKKSVAQSSRVAKKASKPKSVKKVVKGKPTIGRILSDEEW